MDCLDMKQTDLFEYLITEPSDFSQNDENSARLDFLKSVWSTTPKEEGHRTEKEFDVRTLSRQSTASTLDRISLQSWGSCRSASSFYSNTSDMPFELPINLYEYVDEANVDPVIVKLKDFLTNTDYPDHEWYRLVHRNNREVIRFFSLNSHKVSEKMITDMCEVLLVFLDLNFGSLSPSLVTSPFLDTVYSSLHSNLPPADSMKRLKLLNLIYENGGNAFPLLDLRKYLPLLYLCNHTAKQVSDLAHDIVIYAYFRSQNDDLWKLIVDQVSSKSFRRIISKCFDMMKQARCTDFSFACCQWVQACFQTEPTTYFKQHNYFSAVDILIAHTPDVLYNEIATCHYLEVLESILNWHVYKSFEYKSDDIFKLLNNLLEEGVQRNYDAVCEAISVILNSKLALQATMDFNMDDLCLAE